MQPDGSTNHQGTSRARRRGLLLLMCCCLPQLTAGAEVVNASVTRHDERFILHAETVVHAPIAKVRALLADYENLPRINRDLKWVTVLRRYPDAGVRIRIGSDFCVLAICLNFRWTEEVHPQANGDITVMIVPNRGDFRHGNGRWRFLSENDKTRLIFDADLTPNFWMPPVFGPWLMKQKLADEAYETAQGLERIATVN